MEQKTFNKKWSDIDKKRGDEKNGERSLFVEKGKKPVTQRQLNLYYYFRFLEDILRKNNARNIIEVGCGRGTIALYIYKYLGLKPHLLDKEEDAVNIAKELFRENNAEGEFFVRDILNSGLPNDKYDAVVSIGLAEHFSDPEDLYRAQLGLLRDGGVMASLNIPEKRSIQELNIVMRWFKKLFGKYKDGARKDYYRNNLTPNQYREKAIKAGFKDVKIMNVCPFPIFTPINISTDKNITKIYRFILSIRKIFQSYPYKSNKLVSQAHFLVAYK